MIAVERGGPCLSGRGKRRADLTLWACCSVVIVLLWLVASPPQPTAAPVRPSPGPVRPFSYSVQFATNQHGHPESSCERPICRELRNAIAAARSSIDFAV